MTNEDQHTDCKSLRVVTGRTAGWDALIAEGSVAFEEERRWRRYRPAPGAVKDK